MARPNGKMMAGRPPTAWPDDDRYPSGGGSRRGPGANSLGKNIDVKELLKREAFSSPNDASDNHFEKNRPSPDAIYGVSDQYMTFDTFSQVESSSPATGTLKWNFMVQGVTGDQAIGVKDKIDTVIEIQLGQFNMPPLPPVPFTLNAASSIPGVGINSSMPILTVNGAAPPMDPLTSPLTQIPFGNKVTVELKELGLQSFADRKNARHHFEFQATPDLVATAGGVVDRGDLVLTPLHGGWDTFMFTDPIKDVHGLTFTFRNPDIPLVLPQSCLYGATAQVSAAGQFLQFNFQAHGLNAGDRIFVEGFTTANPIINNYINRVQGLVVGAGGLTADNFRLNPDVDTSLLALALGAAISSSTRTTVFVAKNRMRIPARFRRVVPRLTNYISP